MTREIRARESASGFSKIPIIAITADAVGHDRQKGIDVGMDAYLTKPVRLGDLSQMLSLYLVGEEQGARCRAQGALIAFLKFILTAIFARGASYCVF